jgi:hypothetical protein
MPGRLPSSRTPTAKTSSSRRIGSRSPPGGRTRSSPSS